MNYKSESLSRRIKKGSVNWYTFCHNVETVSIFKKTLWIEVKVSKTTHLRNDPFTFKVCVKILGRKKKKKNSHIIYCFCKFILLLKSTKCLKYISVFWALFLGDNVVVSLK